jgi:peroxiredoxin
MEMPLPDPEVLERLQPALQASGLVDSGRGSWPRRAVAIINSRAAARVGPRSPGGRPRAAARLTPPPLDPYNRARHGIAERVAGSARGEHGRSDRDPQGGDPAPDFELVDQNGATVRLSDFRGRKHVVVAFHPLAFTGVCQRQMRDYQQHLSRFHQADAEVVSISVDSRHAKKAWADQMGGIDYSLLADFEPKGAVARAYGVYREANGYATRALVLVDKRGIVRYIDSQENPGQDPNNEALFAALAEL